MTSSKTLVWRPDSNFQDSASPHEGADRSAHAYRRHRRHQRPASRRRSSRRPLSPELLAQIRAEGYGRAYVQKQIRKKTPMVFELYGETVEGIIVRRLTYSLDVLSDGQVRRIEKINIKYMYKWDEAPRVRQHINYDEALKHQNLSPIVLQSERYEVDDSVLTRGYKEKVPVTSTLRGGEIITGFIDWFSQYEIKINLVNGRGIVVFRHGVYNLQVNSPSF